MNGLNAAIPAIAPLASLATPSTEALAQPATDLQCVKCVATTDIVLQAITTGRLRDTAVTTNKIADGAITESKLGAGAVTNSRIALGAVREGRIANKAVTTPKIALGAVVEGRLANGAVTANKLRDGAVTTKKMQAGAVTNGRLAAGAVGSGKIRDGSVATADIADGAITEAKLASDVGLASDPTLGQIVTATSSVDFNKSCAYVESVYTVPAGKFLLIEDASGSMVPNAGGEVADAGVGVQILATSNGVRYDAIVAFSDILPMKGGRKLTVYADPETNVFIAFSGCGVNVNTQAWFTGRLFDVGP